MDQTLKMSADYKSQNIDDFKLPVNVRYLMEDETVNHCITPNRYRGRVGKKEFLNF